MVPLPRGFLWCFCGLLFVVMVAAAQADDAVTLRPVAVSVSVGGVIRVADVANLEGLEALELGAVAVRRGVAAGPATVTLDEVRAALEAAGANLGRLQLRGHASCAVDVRAPAAIAPTPGPLPPTPADREALEPETPAVRGADPLENRLRPRLAGWLGLLPAEADSLRIAPSEGDAALLNRPAAEARFRLEPLGRPRLGRVSVRIEERDAAGTLTLHTVSVTLEREVLAAVVTGPVRRGDTLSSANVGMETVTLGREPAGAAEPLASLDGVLGAEAAVTLLPGTRLVPGHLAKPALVKRGGHVTVRVAAGAVELVAEGRAQADAALGEAVTIRLGDARGRAARTVEAVVSGTNEVRVDQL